MPHATHAMHNEHIVTTAEHALNVSEHIEIVDLRNSGHARHTFRRFDLLLQRCKSALLADRMFQRLQKPPQIRELCARNTRRAYNPFPYRDEQGNVLD